MGEEKLEKRFLDLYVPLPGSMDEAHFSVRTNERLAKREGEVCAVSFPWAAIFYLPKRISFGK